MELIWAHHLIPTDPRSGAYLSTFPACGPASIISRLSDHCPSRPGISKSDPVPLSSSSPTPLMPHITWVTRQVYLTSLRVREPLITQVVLSLIMSIYYLCHMPPKRPTTVCTRKGSKCRRPANSTEGSTRVHHLLPDDEGTLQALIQQVVAAAVEGAMPTVVAWSPASWLGQEPTLSQAQWLGCEVPPGMTQKPGEP